MSYLIEQRRTLSFLRLPFAAKRRRVRPVLVVARRVVRCVLWLTPVALFVVWLMASSTFHLSDYELVGQPGRVDEQWVRQTLAAWSGHNLVGLDLEPVRRELESHPWVQSVQIRKSLPGTVSLRFHEHSPVALLQEVREEGEAHFVSREGVVIADPAGPSFDGLRLIAQERPPQAELLRALELTWDLEALDIDWLQRVESVTFLTDGDYELRARGIDFPVVVAAATASTKMEILDRLLPTIEHRVGALDRVDLRFPRRVVIQPRVDDGVVSTDGGGLG